MFFNPIPFMNFGEKYSHSIKQQQQHFLSSGAGKPSLTVGCLQCFGTAESAGQRLPSPIQCFRYYRWPFVPCSRLPCLFWITVFLGLHLNSFIGSFVMIHWYFVLVFAV